MTPDQTRELAVRLYASGFSSVRVAATLGPTETTIIRWVRQSGQEVRVRSAHNAHMDERGVVIRECAALKVDPLEVRGWDSLRDGTDGQPAAAHPSYSASVWAKREEAWLKRASDLGIRYDYVAPADRGSLSELVAQAKAMQSLKALRRAPTPTQDWVDIGDRGDRG